MLTKKSLLIAGVAATIGIAGTVGANAAFAFHDNKNDDLVARIAQEFNLSEAEVQAVFDDYKSDQEEAKVSAYLQTLVDKGKITAEQKTAIETKLTEVRAEMKAEHDALEVWAETEGIDIEYVFKYDLQKLVDEGKITAEQKVKIEAKREELKDKREAMRTELKQWAADNNINVKYLMMGKGYFGPHHFGHHDHHDYNHDDKHWR
jgi:competence protein ComGC